jgi:hypothetical protein
MANGLSPVEIRQANGFSDGGEAGSAEAGAFP